MTEIKPVTRIAWWSKELKNLWEPRLDRIRETYNAAELATVLADMRRVFVYHVNSNNFEGSYEFLRKNNLVYFPTNKSGVYNGFSHKHQPVEQGKPYMLYGAAVKSDDLEAGEIFSEASAGNTNHGDIGDLLGYPRCCIDFFNETWNSESIDPIYESAINTDDAEINDEDEVTVKCHPHCNNMLRYFGLRITPHLPCSMTCESTIKWGEEWVDIMRQIDNVATDWALELLSMPNTWNCLKGVAIIENPIFRGITNSDMCLTKKFVNNLGWLK